MCYRHSFWICNSTNTGAMTKHEFRVCVCGVSRRELCCSPLCLVVIKTGWYEYVVLR